MESFRSGWIGTNSKDRLIDRSTWSQVSRHQMSRCLQPLENITTQSNHHRSNKTGDDALVFRPGEGPVFFQCSQRNLDNDLKTKMFHPSSDFGPPHGTPAAIGPRRRLRRSLVRPRSLVPGSRKNTCVALVKVFKKFHTTITL